MLTVSNTSPILNLAIIEHLELLPQQFETVWIPQAVQEELRLDEDLPGSLMIGQALANGWLRVQPVENVAFAQVLARELDRGEAEAIVLAIEMGADRLLLDEREARRVAKTLQLPVTGVLGILLSAYQANQLSLPMTSIVEALQEKAGFRLADSLVQAVLQACGEGN